MDEGDALATRLRINPFLKAVGANVPVQNGYIALRI